MDRAGEGEREGGASKRVGGSKRKEATAATARRQRRHNGIHLHCKVASGKEVTRESGASEDESVDGGEEAEEARTTGAAAR